MKKNFIVLAIMWLAGLAANAAMPVDHDYYVVDTVLTQRFDTYNDGVNTYIEAVPGLVVRGATADGDYLIVHGLPKEIRATYKGRPITITRGIKPQPVVPVVREDVKKATLEKEIAKQQAEMANIKKLADAKREVISSDRRIAPEPLDVTAEQSVQHWKIAKGQTLRYAFEQWCKDNQMYSLYWEPKEPVVVQVDVDLNTTFEKAITDVINAVNNAADAAPSKGGGELNKQSTMKLHASFLRGNNPKLLRITER